MLVDSWRPVVGFEEKFEVSIEGKVRSLRSRFGVRPYPREVTPSVVTGGYLYFQVWDKGALVRTVAVHRAVFEAFVHPLSEGLHIDHIDGDVTNNRVDNLRQCSPSQNLQNQRRSPEGKSSKYKGVSWCKRYEKFMAYITYARRRKFLGYHECEHTAARTYNTAARMFFGEFSCLNEVTE